MTLSINQLSKTYPNGVKALDHLSIEIGSGMFGLLGPNGAGKSSLMRTIATLQKPDSGSIAFNDINVLEDQMSLRQVLGYLPQAFGVYPRVSAAKLLDYFAILKGIATKRDRNMLVDEVLQLTNLYEVRHKHVSSYSGGMKQRFGIAQLLLNNPKLIIVDEPTAGLDPAERNRFLNVLREISSNNIVIFSTHLVEDVKELCTDMAIMNKGQILKRMAPIQATKDIAKSVWIKQISKEELNAHKASYSFLSSSFNEDNSLTIRVFDPEQPDPAFQLASTTTLEDVYFATLNDYTA